MTRPIARAQRMLPLRGCGMGGWMACGMGGPRLRAASALMALMLVLLPALTGEATAQKAPFAQEAPFVQTGVASYYAEEFHGKRTANGETYSMWAMTAAHQTLPFNSLVKVTNLENGKSIVVRINDAGPFVDNRIIDLTRAGAAKLGMIEKGTARVRLEVVGRDESRATTVSDNEYYDITARRTQLEGFGIQLGSFEDMDNLIRQLDALARKGVRDAVVQIARTDAGVLHRIVVGNFPSRAAAEKRLAELKASGLAGFVFQIR